MLSHTWWVISLVQSWCTGLFIYLYRSFLSGSFYSGPLPPHCKLCNKTDHSFLPDDRHPVLHAVHSVGDLGEVVFPQGLLTHGEGAVVRSRHTEVIAGTETTEKWTCGWMAESVLKTDFITTIIKNPNDTHNNGLILAIVCKIDFFCLPSTLSPNKTIAQTHETHTADSVLTCLSLSIWFSTFHN